MGLLEGSQNQYYTGSNLGNYQFVTLESIINGFMVAYVGESKLIPKANPADVQFHAMRAAQELSYDVLRSFKSQEIEIPPSLKMMLPHDYVNYVKLSRVGDDGIKRLLYPTGKTSNPFPVLQAADGSYDFQISKRSVKLTVKPNITSNWTDGDYLALGFMSTSTPQTLQYMYFRFEESTDSGSLVYNQYTNPTGEGPVVGISVQSNSVATIAEDIAVAINNMGHHTAVTSLSEDGQTGYIDIEYKENLSGTPSAEGIYKANGTSGPGNAANGPSLAVVNAGTGPGSSLVQQSADSDTWENYKTQSSGNNSYDNDEFDLDARGRRYGLDPQHAQDNGTFFIDQRTGFIHFSSSLASETVILDYVSDGVGTDAEMVVHKFAEEAVYKWIAYGMVSTRSNMPDFVVQRFKRERFAETRKAKIRLSNIKMEEFTQILKGMSKIIK